MNPQREVLGNGRDVLKFLYAYWKTEFPMRGAEAPGWENMALWLAGAEEIESYHRDVWGNWEGSFSPRFYHGQLLHPQINEWLEEKAAYRPSWPNKKKYSIALTHDIDRTANEWTRRQNFRFVTRFLKAIDRRSLSKKEQLQMLGNALFRQVGTSQAYPRARGIELALEIEASANAHASYLFTVYPTEPLGIYDCAYHFDDPCQFEGKKQQVSDLICEISRRGHDVGLHGSYFSAVDHHLLKSQRQALEAVVGKPVTSTRQHYLRWESSKTAWIQEQAGFKVDSTLGFNRTIGFRNAIALPFHPFVWSEERASRVLEVPLVLQDGALFGTYGLELDAEKAIAVSQIMIDRVRSYGGCLSILVHPDRLEDPRVERWFRWLLDYGNQTEGWITSLQEIEKWWSRII